MLVQNVVGPRTEAYHFADHNPGAAAPVLDQSTIQHLVRMHAPTFVDLMLLAHSRSVPLRQGPSGGPALGWCMGCEASSSELLSSSM